MLAIKLCAVNVTSGSSESPDPCLSGRGYEANRDFRTEAPKTIADSVTRLNGPNLALITFSAPKATLAWKTRHNIPGGEALPR